MIEGQIETITGDEMIRQPTQSISGIDGRPLCHECGGKGVYAEYEFERVARNEEWYSNGRLVGKDNDMGIGTVISVQQAQFIVDAHSWTITELSRAHNADLAAAAERFWDEIKSAYRKGYLEGSASNGVLRKRIAELEEQLPKVVRPEKETDYPLSYWCDCDGEVFSGDVACRQCGAKLDWSDV